MAINLKPETERLVQEELQNGHFRSVDEMIVEGVHARRVGNAFSGEINRKTPAEAVEHIRQLRRGNRLPAGVTITTLLTKAGLDRVRSRQFCHHALVLREHFYTIFRRSP